MLRRVLPQNPPWWEVFNADRETILEISDAILSLYHMPKFQWLEPLADVDYLKYVEKQRTYFLSSCVLCS